MQQCETIKVKLTAIDENGDALAFREKLSISVTPAGTAAAPDYAL